MGINLDDFVIRRGSTGDVTGVTVDTATGLTGGGTSGDIPVAIGTVPLANGGTGATTASAARTALGLGTLSTMAPTDIFTRHVDSSGTATQINYDSHIKYVTATGALGTTITGSGTTADPYVITFTSPDTISSYTLPAATSTALGGVKILSTAANAAMQIPTTTANRNYSIQHMAEAQAMVNVPWTDTTYSLATASVSGLCQVYSTVEANSTVCEEEIDGRRYKIQHDSDSDLSVCVPWTDTVYTHPTSAGNKHIPAGGSASQILKYSSAGTAVWADLPTTITTAQASAITANTAKVTFPGLGTSSTTALAGDTTTISSAQASAITANTAKVTFPGIGTSSTTCMAGNTSIPVDLTSDGAGTVHANNITAIGGDVTIGGAITSLGTRINANQIGANGNVGNTEYGYLNGVTGAIQTQLDAKAPLASPTLTGTPAAPTAAASTNTTQIATTAYVKDQYTLVYMQIHGQGIQASDDIWYFPKDVGGVEYYKWEDATDSVSVTATEFTLPRGSQHKGIVMPYDCILVGFIGNSSASGNSQGAFSLWEYQPHWGEGGSGGTTATRTHYGESNISISSEGGESWSTTTNYTTRPGKVVAYGGEEEGTNAPVTLTAGTAILPAASDTVTDGGSNTQRITMTIILKVKLEDYI